MTPQEQDTGQVQELLGAFYAGRIDRTAVRASVMDVILARLGCQRVSMWKFEGSAGRLNLLCFASKAVGGELDSRERRLLQSEYRDYFNALIERGTYVASDAMNDPQLAAMREPWLVPNNVRSLLDAGSCSTAAPTARSAASRPTRRATGAPATCWPCAPS